MINTQSYYPKLVANQVLGSGHLNDLFNYLNEQERLTRTHLIGMGIVCGLDVSVKADKTEVRISPGCGVTSAGYLVRWTETEELRYAAPYELPALIDYNFFDDPDGGSPRPQLPMWELTPRKNGNDEAELLTDSFMRNKAVMLVYETSESENANCTPTSCDDNGRTVDLLVKAVVIDYELLDKVRGILGLTVSGAEEYYSLLTGRVSRYNLPVLRAPRYDVLNSNPVSTRQLMEGFQSAFSEYRLRVMQDALDAIYASLRPVLGDAAASPANKVMAMKFLYDTGDDGLLEDGRAVDYGYYLDHFTSLVRAYEELRSRAADLFGLCMPDERVFPKHLVLHTEAEDPTVAEDAHRHYWVSSPVQNRQMDLREEIRVLYERLYTMLTGAQKTQEVKEIRITPSRLSGLLSEGAIPCYYPAELHRSWNFRLRTAGRTDEILGYFARQWSGEPAARQPLEYDLAPYNFFRIEGNLGQPVKAVVEELRAIMRDYRLPVEVVALRTGTLTDRLEIEDFSASFADLEALYQDIRARLRGRMAEVAAHLYDIWIVQDPVSSGSTNTPGKYKLNNWREIMLNPDLLTKLQDNVELIPLIKDKVGVVEALANDVSLADKLVNNKALLELAPNTSELSFAAVAANVPLAANLRVDGTGSERTAAVENSGSLSFNANAVYDNLEIYVPAKNGFEFYTDFQKTASAKRTDYRARATLLADLNDNYTYEPGTLGDHYETFLGRHRDDGPYRGNLPDAYSEPLGLLHDLISMVERLPATLFRSDMEALIERLAEFQAEWRQKSRDRSFWLNELRPAKDGAKAPDIEKLDLEEYSDQLDLVLTNGDLTALRQLLSTHETRREEVLRRQLFSVFQEKHPGLQAALGAMPGGTLVLAYHGSEGDRATVDGEKFQVDRLIRRNGKAVSRVQVTGPGIRTVTNSRGRFQTSATQLPLKLELTPQDGDTVIHFIISAGTVEVIDLDNPRTKAEDGSVPGIDKDMVVASFHLPYRIGNEAPPVYLMPAMAEEPPLPPLTIEKLDQVTGSKFIDSGKGYTAPVTISISGGSGNYEFVDTDGEATDLIDPTRELINGLDYTIRDKSEKVKPKKFRAQLTPPLEVSAAAAHACDTDGKNITHKYRITGGYAPYSYIDEQKKEVTLETPGIISIRTANKKGFELVTWDNYGRTSTEKKTKVPAFTCTPPLVKCTLPGKSGIFDLQSAPLWAQAPTDAPDFTVVYKAMNLKLEQLTYSPEKGFGGTVDSFDELNKRLATTYKGDLNEKDFLAKTKEVIKLIGEEINKQFKTADGSQAVELALTRSETFDGLEVGVYRVESFSMTVSVTYQVFVNGKAVNKIARKLVYTGTRLTSEQERVSFASYGRKVQKKCPPAGKVELISDPEVKKMKVIATRDLRSKSAVFSLLAIKNTWPRYWIQPDGTVEGGSVLALGEEKLKGANSIEVYAVDPSRGDLYRGVWTTKDGIADPPNNLIGNFTLVNRTGTIFSRINPTPPIILGGN